MYRLTFIFLWLSFAAIAQTAPADYQRAYQTALRAYQDKQYEEALHLFAPLTHARYQNELTPYCHYFMALAYLKTQHTGDGRAIIRQLENRFPQWSKLDDAHLLYANFLLEEGNYDLGIDALKRLNNSSMAANIQNLETVYLAKCLNLSTLKQIQKKYPNDPIIATNLVDLIRVSSTNKADLDLADQLSVRFGFGVKTQSPAISVSQIQARKAEKKSSYAIGILLPFHLSEQEKGPNQYIIDLYEGIKLAVRKLQSEGTNVTLYAYDVDNTPEPLEQIMADKQFQALDLLVGPLYPKTYQMASAWALPRKIPIISPLSTNGTIIQGQPNAYLVQPSIETQAKEILKFANTFLPKSTLIAYGSNRQDSLLAITYADLATKAGVKVLGCKRGLSDQNLTELNGKKPGHFLGIFSNQGSAPSILSWTNRSGLNCPIFIPYESINPTTTSASSFAGQLVYLYDTAYPSEKQAATLDFRQNYLTRVKTLPSTYAYLGYDTMLFFGRMLGKFGTDFSKGVKYQEYTDGYTLGGFDYRNANDNQALTILRYTNYQFIPEHYH
ncbi:MAG: ABC transporter substrate-binding protein [Siphonobacter sp.]